MQLSRSDSEEALSKPREQLQNGVHTNRQINGGTIDRAVKIEIILVTGKYESFTLSASSLYQMSLETK